MFFILHLLSGFLHCAKSFFELPNTVVNRVLVHNYHTMNWSHIGVSWC